MRRCELCRDTLEDADVCIVPECPYRASAQAGLLQPATGLIAQPPPPPAPLVSAAPRLRRLAATGPELLLALAAEALGAALGPIGVAVSLSLAAFFALRDQGGGHLSPGKRILGVQVVDAVTGDAPTPRQAVLRNAPWVGVFVLAAVPGVELLAWALMAVGATVALLMALVAPGGRRLGDWIAGTRVISGRPPPQ